VLIEGGTEQERLNKPWINPVPAIVPGSVHSALWKNGIIPEPYFGMNDSIARKYCFKTWWYKNEFSIDKVPASPVLRFNGVAIDCSVWLNGVFLGTHSGTFGVPEYNVSKILKKNNILVVKIDPAPFANDNETNYGWRKKVTFNCVYGWHYSNIPSLGIWKDVEIHNSPDVETGNLFIVTKSLDGEMNLQVPLKSKKYPFSGRLLVSVEPENFRGEPQSFSYDVNSKMHNDTLNFSFRINDPHLWWPNDMGKQNLYKLGVCFITNDGSVSDSRSVSFGIRTITMAPLSGGPDTAKYNWTFVINNKPHFVKGVNWCTMDPLMDFSVERYTRFLSLARDQHIQILRAWGGGLPETNEFYNLCDKLGIMVIQEWPTAWDSHNEQPFDVLEETVWTNTLRLRNHPSLVMWCGGNESAHPYGKAINMMGSLSIQLDNSRPFHRGEPLGGSQHNYTCWWKNAPLDTNLNLKAEFWGEFGLASAPVKESVKRYIPSDELNKWPIDSAGSFAHHTPVFNRRQQDMSRLMQYAGYFTPGSNLDDLILGSQLAQVVGVRHTLERSRARWPYCTGAIYYKLNDNFPAVSWSSVDWYGAPKPIHYFVQDAFAPIAAIVIFSSTDLSKKNASLPVFLLDDNLSLAGSKWKVKVSAFNSRLDLIDSVVFNGADNNKVVDSLGVFSLDSVQTTSYPLFIVSEISVNDSLAYKTFYFMNFEKGKDNLCNLPETEISQKVTGDKLVLKNTGKKPAAAVNIRSVNNADKFTASDNFFWLDAGEEKTVTININSNIVVDFWNKAR
jgi:beta-mannosidase